MPVMPLRPPGAAPGGEFGRLCTQCGQCAGACPFRSIVLDVGVNPLESGMPRVEPKRIPCWLCMRCGPACPTGALIPVDKREARMGTAVIDRKRCYTYIGSVLCKTCFEKCPLKARAIELDLGLYPAITKQCVGCGVCEHVCPAQCIDTFPAGAELPPVEEQDQASAGSRSGFADRPHRGGVLGLLAKIAAKVSAV